MTASAVCPKCGGHLPATAPEGLCPRCLLRSVLRKPPPLGPAKGPPPIPGIPIRVGDYELLHEVGRGGMGVVYQARQAKLNRLVAIKLMPLGRLAGERAKQRVRNEAQAAARLQHPNIVAVYDVGEHEGAPFICMEYVEGENLEGVVRNRSLKPNEAVEMVRTLAIAVQFAHEHGVIHRDLKPSNVMLDKAGRARIADFGLARHLDSDVSLTASGQALGTPSFMSPEQAGGRRGQVGAGTDVYSLGGILYFLLTGRPPFVADSRDEVISQVLRADPVAPRRLNASIPKDLQTICLKCLDKNPGRRYQTAEELGEDLGRLLRREPIRARPAGVGTKMWRWCQRQPLAASLLAGLLLVSSLAALALFVGFAMAVAGWSTAERSAAEQKRLREIAEEALRGLEKQSSSPYQTAGVFRFKVPPGFVSVSGEKVGMLRQAMLKSLTVEESQRLTTVIRTNFVHGALAGANAGAEGSEPAPVTSDNVALYERGDGKCRIAFLSVRYPGPVAPESVEKTANERFAAGFKGIFPGAVCKIVPDVKIDGQPALLATMVDPSSGFSVQTYIVFVRERPEELNVFTVNQMAEPFDEDAVRDLVKSVRIVVHE